MKTMGKLWENARELTQGAMARADRQVNGTPRAQARYAALPDPVRTAMREQVVEEFGQASWDDFERAIGGGSNGSR